MNFKLLIICLIAITMGTVAYAAQTVNDRIEIDNDDNVTLANGDLFGYQIEAIGDLDSDGVIDLATINFSDDSGEANAGSILILFMNGDGSVRATQEIIMDDSAGNLNGCLGAASLNRDFGSLEQLAFVGDLDGDGEPTLALGANSNDHDTGGGVVVDTGAVYMLELNSDGTVDNCVVISEDISNFAPADGVYIQNGIANFGWPVIATDLNGDGQNELLVGANSESGLQTDLWPLFLNTDGTVNNHPATPVSGLTIGIDSNEFMDDGASISGTKIMVSNNADGDGGGSIFIVNLSAAGAFVSTTEIAGTTIGGIDNDMEFGAGLAPLGDMDNDGVNDILVGNPAGDETNALSGEAYILYLNADDSVKETQEISNISENARAAVSPFAASDLFGHGMAVWRESGSNAVIAISAHQDGTGVANSGAIHLFYVTRASSAVTASSNGGSSDHEHKSKPTFGIDEKSFAQKVDYGLTINEVQFEVDDNYWTQIPMQNLTVGVTQNFTSKLFAPHQLNVMEFLFGIPEVGKWQKAEASVALTFDYAGDFEGVTWNDKFHLINQTSLSFSHKDALCGPNDTVEQCIQVSIELEFKESPEGKVLALQAIDSKRRSSVLYFNDGLTFYGESQNPPLTKEIISKIKYKGLQTIQRIDKAQDIWITLDENEPVLKYQQNDFGTFIPIENRIFEKIADPLTSNIDRLHSEFDTLMQYERMRATGVFDSSLIISEQPTSWKYDYPIEDNRIESIRDTLELEKIRTAHIMDMIYKNHKKVIHNFED